MFLFKNNKTKKGFTLIELLIVIAIIGILSSVVIVSLNVSRVKAKSAAVKSQLTNTKVAAGLVYNPTTSSYGLANSTAGCEGLISNSSFGSLMATSSWPVVNGVLVPPTCFSNASTTGDKITAYSMWHALPTGGGWCVDSTGKSIQKNTAPNSVDCGEADPVPTTPLISCTVDQIGYTVSGSITPNLTGDYYPNGNTVNGQPIYARGNGTYYLSYNNTNFLWSLGTNPGNTASSTFFRANLEGDYFSGNGGVGTAKVTYSNCLPTVTHTVTFDANGGTGAMSPQTLTANTPTNLTPNTFTRSSYTFSGWNTLANGTGTTYADQASYTIGLGDDVTLYAKWTLTLYTPYMWVANNGGYVSKLNSFTGANIGTYGPGAGNNPYGIAVDANGNVWVANFSTFTVSKLNGSTGATIGTYAVGTRPVGVAVDANNNIWVSHYSSNDVYKLNGSTGAVIGIYAVGATPYGIAIDANGYVWVANNGSNNVTKLNGSTGAVIGTYAAGITPYGIAVDVNGNIWVTRGSQNSVIKFNGSTGATIGTYTVGNWPKGIAVDANNNIWVANNGSGTVSKLNGSTGAVIGNYAVGSNPQGVSVDASGNIWVVNQYSNNVTKLNGSTGALVGTYSVGGLPYSLGDMTGFALQYFVLGIR